MQHDTWFTWIPEKNWEIQLEKIWLRETLQELKNENTEILRNKIEIKL